VKPALLISLVFNLLLAGGVGYFAFLGKPSNPSKSGSGVGQGSRASSGSRSESVEALGRVQPSNGLIGIHAPPGERVVSYSAKLGDRVETGAILGVLSGEDERALNLATLDKQIEEAKALHKAIERTRDAKLVDIDAEAAQAQAGLNEDKATIAAKVKGATARKKNAESEMNRLTSAMNAGVKVSDQEMDQLKLVVDLADAEMEGANAQQKKIEANQAAAKESIQAKKSTVEAETARALAQVPLASLQAARNLAARKLQDGLLKAPTTGTVVKILSKPGETIGTFPVIQLADTTRMAVLAEVYETDIARLREWLNNGPVNAEVDARAMNGGGQAKIIKGTVTGLDKVSVVIAKNVLTPLGPREDADRRVVEVHVDLEPGQGVEAFIGVQVRVRFGK
jgi:HlyD family secretion protein